MQTELRYAWGSQALMPVEKRVACPPLQPGEKGSVVVLLNIPGRSIFKRKSLKFKKQLK